MVVGDELRRELPINYSCQSFACLPDCWNNLSVVVRLTLVVVMKTRLLIPAVLRKYSNEKLEISFDGDTVGEFLGQLKQVNPAVYGCICDETGRMRKHINLFLDNEILRRDDFDRKLEPGVVVSVFQAVSGG